MEKLCVLCTTMHQTDLRKYEEMGIRSDVVFANQCGRDEKLETTIDGHCVRMISTSTRGVGKNRNIALMAADADILLFADDDMHYRPDYAQQVVKAFEDLPQADMIIFSIELTKGGEVSERRINPIKRRRLWNCLRYGTYVLAARRTALLRKNINFTTLFGGGCIYSCGEDSMFILDCLRAGLKIYSHSYILGTCAKDESSWFTGYNEKFFFDKGAWIAAAFPRAGFVYRHYFAWRFHKRTELSYWQCCRLIKRGERGFAKLTTWSSLRC